MTARSAERERKPARAEGVQAAWAHPGAAEQAAWPAPEEPLRSRVATELVLDDDTVRSCVLRNSCGVFLQSTTVSQCITLNLLSTFLGNGCLANATNCAAVTSCNGVDYADADCAGQVGSFCVGNRAVDCSVAPPRGISQDCAKAGGTCDVAMVSGTPTAGCRVLDSCPRSVARLTLRRRRALQLPGRQRLRNAVWRDVIGLPYARPAPKRADGLLLER